MFFYIICATHQTHRIIFESASLISLEEELKL